MEHISTEEEVVNSRLKTLASSRHLTSGQCRMDNIRPVSGRNTGAAVEIVTSCLELTRPCFIQVF